MTSLVHFSWPGLEMLSGSCTSDCVTVHGPDEPMPCIVLLSLTYEPIPSPDSSPGWSGMNCLKLRNLISSVAVATALAVVRAREKLPPMAGLQGLRQWLAGCF